MPAGIDVRQGFRYTVKMKKSQQKCPLHVYYNSFWNHCGASDAVFVGIKYMKFFAGINMIIAQPAL